MGSTVGSCVPVVATMAVPFVPVGERRRTTTELANSGRSREKKRIESSKVAG